MLREGIEITGEDIKLDGLTDPSCTNIEGIAHSDALLVFANAFMGDDKSALSKSVEMLAQKMGAERLADRSAGDARRFGTTGGRGRTWPWTRRRAWS